MKKTKIVALGLAMLSLCSSISRAVDGRAALQSADASCPDDSGTIYVDCGNGTVTDNRTGLVWLKNANCVDAATWYQATELVEGLSDLPGSDPDDCGLSDGSSPGEWRLPSKGDWQAMVADAVPLSCDPLLTDDEGTGCWSPGCHTSGACAFASVVPAAYWSSTSLVLSPSHAFPAFLGMVINNGNKTAGLHFWPVRGGQ